MGKLNGERQYQADSGSRMEASAVVNKSESEISMADSLRLTGLPSLMGVSTCLPIVIWESPSLAPLL